MVQWVTNLPAMQKTWVQSLGREDPLREGMETHSSILAWRISWAEEPGGLVSMGSQSDMTEATEHSHMRTKWQPASTDEFNSIHSDRSSWESVRYVILHDSRLLTWLIPKNSRRLHLV